MKKRVIAWILLVGFLLMFIDIIFLHIYMVPVVTVYIFVALLYWFVLRKDAGRNNNGDKE